MLNSVSANFAAIVLAAGEGKRMKSPFSKVLYPIAGRPMLSRTVEILKAISPEEIVIVANPKNVRRIKKIFKSQVKYAIQKKPLGTADATVVGLKSVKKNLETVAVMYGDDTAFYKPETILKVHNFHQKSGAKITFVTITKQNPTGFGRIIRKNGKVVAIVEEKEATTAQRKIKEVNDGLYFFEKNYLSKNISRLTPSIVSGELYLTDLVKRAIAARTPMFTYHLKDESQWHGINTQEELAEANIKFGERIHIMGVGGAGAAAIAGIALAYGYGVSGCDLQITSPYLKSFDKKDIKKGHNPDHLANIGKLIVSPAVIKLNPENRELLDAKKLKIPILTWQEFQAKFLQQDKFVIAVAGAYGKSTTAAMISQILIDAKLDPTCEIGAEVLAWKANFRVGQSKYYVCEADEYNNNFLNYQPDIALILNVDWDHPDYFKTRQSVVNAYKKFIGQIKKSGTLVIADKPQILNLAKSVPKNVKVVKVANFGQIKHSLIGDFRRENATAALTIAKILQIDVTQAKKSISHFSGTGRRLEFKGQIENVKVFDDYAVQPYTAKMTVNALCSKFKNKKVTLVFEPHTFSRINTFFDDFVSSLKQTKVAKILITQVYAARERGDTVSLAKKLARAIGSKAKFSGTLKQTAKYLKINLKNIDIICSMGAGDSYKLWDLLKES